MVYLSDEPLYIEEELPHSIGEVRAVGLAALQILGSGKNMQDVNNVI